ncbi:hypothetical protein IQ243_25360 [Nostocales cyanobacterium LEGE 11386]|nr:hypothetical protein [Nostocales cyanobacterium LEGE 11386]
MNFIQTILRSSTLSEGDFSLILLRCNSEDLRQSIVEELAQISVINIQKLTLTSTVNTLFTAIKEQLGDEKPQALIVFGLESVYDIDTVLTTANRVREEFRKQFPFPVFLWVNDLILRKFIRLSPDLENWASIIEITN